MADGGDSYERFFRAGGPEGNGPDSTGPDSTGPDSTQPRPETTGPGRAGTGSARPPRPPHRRSMPSPAQQRLMARIESSRKARQRRAFLVASGCMSALVLFISGAGWALTGYINHIVHRVNADTTPAAAGAPLNILVAGVDSRAGLSHREEAALHVGRVSGTENSDTMMLVHISPATDRVTVVSLPRDSWVNIPGHGMNKINAAYGLGGPALMVRTVEQATGLTINDYVEVGFLAFVKTIDALGGVNVCLPVGLYDQSSGIHLSAGFHHLNGISALKYARDRHSFPLEDLTRIKDQQSLLSTALSKIISSGTLTNPVRMASLLNSVLPALRVDSKLNVSALADEMRGITSRDVVFVTVPLGNLDYQAPNGEVAVQWDAAQAGRLFSEIRNDQPVIKPAPAPVKSHQAKSGRTHHSTPRKLKHKAGWVPPGARTAAQAACH